MMVVSVFGPDGSTLISPVADVVNVQWLDELEGAGGGSLTVAADNPTLDAFPSLLDYRNVVKVAVNGKTVGAFLILTHDWSTVSGDSPRQVTAAGPGLLAWLDDAIVYQEFPSSRAAATRWFNWGASEQPEWFDGDEWTAPVDMEAYGASDPSSPFFERPVNWPDTGDAHTVYWVWNDADAWHTADEGWMYFRHPIDVSSHGFFTLFMTGKNRFAAILDGEPLMNIRERKAWRRTYEIDFELDPGYHMLGIKVRTNGGSAGMIAAVMQYASTDDEDDDGTLVVWSGSSGWAGMAYPDQEPGWSAGLVMEVLRDEAIDRGVTSLSNLSLGWSSGTDSAGGGWDEYAWSFTVGDSYMSVVDGFRDFGVDVAVDPYSQELNAWQGRGLNRSAEVVIDVVGHVLDLNEKVEAALRNALLISDEDAWDELEDADSVTQWGRIEAYLDVSQLTNRSAGKVAAAVLAKAKIPAQGVSLSYQPGSANVPWRDFAPGDRISVASRSGGYVARKVVSIAVAPDSNGEPVYTVEVDAVSQDQMDRLQRIIDGGNSPLGTLGGRTAKKDRGQSDRDRGTGMQTKDGVTSYRQTRVKAVDKPSGNIVIDEGPSGILNALHANAQGGYATLGFSIASSGNSVSSELELGGLPILARPRTARALAGNYSGWYTQAQYRYLHSLRGFHCRFTFGTVAYNAATALFVGLAHTMPAAAFTDFDGWASAYAIGVAKDSGGGGIKWATRSDASTAGSADTGLSWRNGEVYEMELTCESGGTQVTARLVNTFMEEATHTFDTIPDSDVNAAAVMGPAVLLGGASSTSLALCSFDSVEPW